MEGTDDLGAGFGVLEGERGGAVVGDDGGQGGGVALEAGTEVQDLEGEERRDGDERTAPQMSSVITSIFRWMGRSRNGFIASIVDSSAL